MQFISNIRFWLFIFDKTEWQSNCRKRNCPSNTTRHVGYRWNLSFEPKSFIMLRVFIDSKKPIAFALNLRFNSIVPHFSEMVLLVVFQSVLRRLSRNCLWGWGSHVGMSTFGMSWSKESRRTALLPGKSPRAYAPLKRKINRRKSTYAKRDSTKRYIHHVRRWISLF